MLVVNRGRSDHQGFDWRLYTDNGMNDAGRETAELSRPDRENFPVNFNVDPALENDEAFIATGVDMWRGVSPRFVRIVEPDLEIRRLEPEIVGGVRPASKPE